MLASAATDGGGDERDVCEENFEQMRRNELARLKLFPSTKKKKKILESKSHFPSSSFIFFVLFTFEIG